MVAPSRPPRTTTASAPAAYAARAPRNPPMSAARPAGTPSTSMPTTTRSPACSADQLSSFQTTTCRQTSGTESSEIIAAAPITPRAAPKANRAKLERSDQRSHAPSAAAGRSAVGLARPAKMSANPASAARSRRRSRMTTASTVMKSATRSGFTAGPQIATGASASHPRADAAATTRPADRAETKTSPATPSVETMLAMRPTTNGSPSDATCR